ncbi:MAG: ABC transporter ATP-binding protein [Gammaproteobacteria bacterium]
MNKIIACSGVSKEFLDNQARIQILKGIDLELHSAQTIAIVGKSGSGKTTLLQILAGLSEPTEGEVFLLKHKLTGLSDSKLAAFRNRYLGFVYQLHHLLPEFTALENVAMPLLIRGKDKISKIKKQAAELLKLVGLEDRLDHKPQTLSGGEKQRVALVRSLITKPACVFADEPTGSLDLETAKKIWELMDFFKNEYKTAFLVVTHDLELAKLMDKTYLLKNAILSHFT